MHATRGANRGPGERPSGRGRGRGGRSRGAFNDRNDRDSSLRPVPTIQQVVVGAPVSIVLKIDQPTGREVQGTVAELLTKGNHPRGIKVRLKDGRVGRVQRMASQEAAEQGSLGMSGLGRNGEVDAAGIVRGKFGVGGSHESSARIYRDSRTDGADEPLNVGLSLADYVVVKGKGKGQPRTIDSTQDEGNPSSSLAYMDESTSLCPVCGEFRGDEIAVAHHVNEHFD